MRCALLLTLCVGSRAPCFAEAAAPGPWPTLQLRGGRVLHNAKFMSDEGDSIIVHADEGLIKIAKSDLPQGAADAFPAPPTASGGTGMVMQMFNPDMPAPAPQAPAPTKKPEPGPAPTPRPKAAPNPVFRGCTIVSFAVKPFQNSLGCAEVVIQNDGGSPSVISPGDIVCITAVGARHGGRQFVADGFPPIVRRREVIQPSSSVDLLVPFTTEPLDIAAVQWAR